MRVAGETLVKDVEGTDHGIRLEGSELDGMIGIQVRHAVRPRSRPLTPVVGGPSLAVIKHVTDASWREARQFTSVAIFDGRAHEDKIAEQKP